MHLLHRISGQGLLDNSDVWEFRTSVRPCEICTNSNWISRLTLHDVRFTLKKGGAVGREFYDVSEFAVFVLVHADHAARLHSFLHRLVGLCGEDWALCIVGGDAEHGFISFFSSKVGLM